MQYNVIQYNTMVETTSDRVSNNLFWNTSQEGQSKLFDLVTMMVYTCQSNDRLFLFLLVNDHTQG